MAGGSSSKRLTRRLPLVPALRAGRVAPILLSGCLFLVLASFGSTASLAQSDGSTGLGPQVRALVITLDRATLAADITSRISKMEPRPGERFEKGDVLVRFVCDRFVAQRDSAKAALNAATKRLESVDKLVAMRSASVLDRDIAQADVDAREAELRLFQADVNRCAIRAPYSGRVVSWYANPHEVSDVGVEIMEVVADGALEVEMIVPSGWLRWLEPGMPISLSVDETGDAFDLSLSVLGAEVDPVSQTVGIRARFTEPPKTLIPGMSGIAIFPKQDNS